MVSNTDSFVIDATFLFEAAHRVVVGAPLLNPVTLCGLALGLNVKRQSRKAK